MRNYILLFFLNLSFLNYSFAKTFSNNQVIEGLSCKEAIGKILPPKQDWLADFARADAKVFKSYESTSKKWFFVIANNNGVSEVRAELGNNIRSSSFSKNCIQKDNDIQIDRFAIPDQNALINGKGHDFFDDARLEKSINSPDLTLVYIWSPEMTYSAKQHNDFMKMATREKFKFLSVVDYKTSRPNLLNAQAKFNISNGALIFRSNDLFQRGALLHFPMSYLVGKGKIWGTGIVGVVDEKTFKKMVRRPAGDVL